MQDRIIQNGLFFKCLFLFLVTCCFFNSTYAQKNSIIKHNKFFDSEIVFYDQEDKKHFIEDYEGDALLLVFWATWCGTCVDEIPKLDNLQKDFRKLPFKVIAISEDYQDIELVKKYFVKHEVKYLDLFKDQNNQLLINLEIAGLPAAYLIDQSGRLKIEFKGKIKWEDQNIREIIISEMEGDYELPKNTFRHRQFFEKIYHESEQKKGEAINEKTETE